MVVDTVTTRRADLNSTILSLLGVDVSGAALPPAGLSAACYRAVGREEESQQLQVWPAPLALPTLPLWIASDFSVPLDLEVARREYAHRLVLLATMHRADALLPTTISVVSTYVSFNGGQTNNSRTMGNSLSSCP